MGEGGFVFWVIFDFVVSCLNECLEFLEGIFIEGFFGVGGG